MSRVPMMSDGGDWFMNPNVNHGLNFIPQGISADLIATIENYSREKLDQFAVESHQKAAVAQNEGRFKNSIIPVKDINGLILLDHDETIRESTNTGALAGLKPSFASMGKIGLDATAMRVYPEVDKHNQVHHAGNSSGIVMVQL